MTIVLDRPSPPSGPLWTFTCTARSRMATTTLPTSPGRPSTRA
ncbi:hypothetical protein NKG94_02560 [Micromonospora sp. M12]